MEQLLFASNSFYPQKFQCHSKAVFVTSLQSAGCDGLTLYLTKMIFDAPEERNIVGHREYIGNQHFLLGPQSFQSN